MRVRGNNGPVMSAPQGFSLRDVPSRGPSLCLYLSEPARGAWTFASLLWAAPWLALAPRGDGHGVLVIPGLLAADRSTQTMRLLLRRLGHNAHGWELGRNLGPTATILDGLPRMLGEIVDRTGEPASIVGWSLGGIFARELARDHPEQVRQVITLGSPFALTDFRQSRADGVYQRRSHLFADVVRIPNPRKTSRPISGPSTAVFSRSDGIVAWQACIEPPTPRHENVEVRCGHLGFGVDPAAVWVMADRLAQPAQRWRPFQPPTLLHDLYPGVR